jgi:enoyl-CoA hydratase/carnithine racemase
MTATAAVQTATEPLLLRSDAGGIATLTLNRPKQYNALSEELLEELQGALEAIERIPSVRVVVMAGSGNAFCAGHDLKQMRANPRKQYYQDLFAACSEFMLTLALPQPVIARVHGIATAAGCQLVAACDLAVAAENAKFAVSGINVGLFCSTPVGAAVPQHCRASRRRRCCSRATSSTRATAKQLGLVNRVVSARAPG